MSEEVEREYVDSRGATVVDVTGLEPHEAWLAFRPYMAHPTDPDRREQYSAYLLGKLVVPTEHLPLIEPATLRRLVEAAELGVGEDFIRASAGGRIAGDVLLHVLSMASYGIEDGGLDRAQFLISEQIQRNRQQGTATGAWGRDSVRKFWSKYRSVAHLWAAEILVSERHADPFTVEADEELLNVDGFAFAAVADCLLSGAQTLKLPRGAATILPADALRIVGAPPGRVGVPELSDEQLEILGRYRMRERGN